MNSRSGFFRRVACTAALFSMTLGASAQTGRGWTVGAGIDGINYVNTLVYALSTLGHGSATNPVDDGRQNEPEIGTLTGLSVFGAYRFGRYLQVGLDAEVQYMASDNWRNVGEAGEEVRTYNGKHTMTAPALMAQVRLYYLSHPSFSLYGEASGGVGALILDKYHSGSRTSVIPAWQVAPIGCTFGRGPWYGFAEIGAGSLWQGMRVGAGYRF